jgi:hypothetical protein
MRGLEALGIYRRPPDGRSAGDVEADIREELAFHISEREGELIEGGMEPAEAAAAARAEFGDVDRVTAQCRGIQLGERIMLQRINLAITLTAVVLLGVFLWRMESGRTQTADGFGAVQAELASLRAFVADAASDPGEPVPVETAASEPAASAAPPRAGHAAGDGVELPKYALTENELDQLRDLLELPSVGSEAAAELGSHVYVMGKVGSPGRYSLSDGRTRLTLSKCIALAGDFEEFADRGKVTVIRATEKGRHRFAIDFDGILEGTRPDFELQPDDLVYVAEVFF